MQANLSQSMQSAFTTAAVLNALMEKLNQWNLRLSKHALNQSVRLVCPLCLPRLFPPQPQLLCQVIGFTSHPLRQGWTRTKLFSILNMSSTPCWGRMEPIEISMEE